MRGNDRADPASCEPLLEVYPHPRPGSVVVVDAFRNARANEAIFDSQTADTKRLEYRLNIRRMSALHLVSNSMAPQLHNALMPPSRYHNRAVNLIVDFRLCWTKPRKPVVTFSLWYRPGWL